MKIIDRIKSKTSKKNRVEGQTATIISAVCGTILASGLVLNPVGILVVSVVGVVAGIKAGKNALKTDGNDE